MNDIRIRAAAASDLRFIPGIERDAARLIPAADLPEDVRFSVTSREDLDAALSASRIWVADAGASGTVGFAMTDIVDRNAHLDEMDVAPAFGRQGIGTRLMRKAVEWARHEKFSRLTLVTFRHLPWNAPFYAKFGFAELPVADQGPELQALIAAEGALGIDTTQRVAMNLAL